jgi:hypothetical protein
VVRNALGEVPLVAFFAGGETLGITSMATPGYDCVYYTSLSSEDFPILTF